MKYEPHWTHPLLLAAVMAVLTLAAEWPKSKSVDMIRKASYSSASDDISKAKANADSMNEATAKAVVGMAEVLYRELDKQIAMRLALEAQLAKLGYSATYFTNASGSQACMLLENVRASGGELVISNPVYTVYNVQHSMITNSPPKLRLVEIRMQGEVVATLTNVIDVIKYHDKTMTLPCHLVRSLNGGGKTNEFHAFMAEVRDAWTHEVLAPEPTAKEYAEFQRQVAELVKEAEEK